MPNIKKQGLSTKYLENNENTKTVSQIGFCPSHVEGEILAVKCILNK